jgi:type IV secretory pathway TrbF-like protein
VKRFFGPARQTNGERTAQDDEGWSPALRTWNDVNGHHIAQKKNWQYVAFLSLATALVCAAGFFDYTRAPRYVPYVVVEDVPDKTVRLAQPLRFDANDPTDALIVKWTLARFIENLRLVSFDTDFERKATRTYVEPFLAPNTQAADVAVRWSDGERKEYRARRYSLEADADEPTQFTPGVYQVNWTETLRNESGAVVAKNRWTSFLTITFRTPNGQKTLSAVDPLNPLGLVVVDIDWRRTTDLLGHRS